MDSKPLTFGELNVGDKFIDFPTDGDDSGHGGFRKGAYVFQKTHKASACEVTQENAFRIVDGCRSIFSDSMQVYKVIL